MTNLEDLTQLVSTIQEGEVLLQDAMWISTTILKFGGNMAVTADRIVDLAAKLDRSNLIQFRDQIGSFIENNLKNMPDPISRSDIDKKLSNLLLEKNEQVSDNGKIASSQYPECSAPDEFTRFVNQPVVNHSRAIHTKYSGIHLEDYINDMSSQNAGQHIPRLASNVNKGEVTFKALSVFMSYSANDLDYNKAELKQDFLRILTNMSDSDQQYLKVNHSQFVEATLGDSKSKESYSKALQKTLLQFFP